MLREDENESTNVRVGTARNVARNLLNGAKIKKPPVYINELIPVLKEEHGLLIEPWLLEDHISGLLLEEDKLSAIAYNKNHHVHRQRFTVAHEIGHLLLGHNHTEGREAGANEKEAQIFASELLMPLEFLKKDLRSSSCDLDTLARRYWVSKSAISWRIQDPHVLKFI